MEPRVDACQVEGVAALRQHPDLVAGGELLQADWAVGEPGGRIHGEVELGERSEDLLLEAPIGLRRGAPKARDQPEDDFGDKSSAGQEEERANEFHEDIGHGHAVSEIIVDGGRRRFSGAEEPDGTWHVRAERFRRGFSG